MSAATWILRPERMDGVRREVRVHHPLPHALEEEDYLFLEEQLAQLGRTLTQQIDVITQTMSTVDSTLAATV